jgi:hypothetical protein
MTYSPNFYFSNESFPHVSSEHDNYKELQSFFFEVILVGMPLLGFCSLRVSQVLSQHISIVSVRLNKTPEQIRIEKSIVKAIIIQGLTPVICTIPIIFIFVMYLLHGGDATALNLAIFRYGENQEHQYTMTYLCFFCITVFPILDPFITLRVMRSYRTAANKCLAKFKIYRKITGTEQEVTVVVHINSPLRPAVAPS